MAAETGYRHGKGKQPGEFSMVTSPGNASNCDESAHWSSENCQFLATEPAEDNAGPFNDVNRRGGCGVHPLPFLGCAAGASSLGNNHG